jgi:hypothetical protein
MRRQPRLGILVVERPRRHDSEERNEGAREADVQRERDVLGHEADEEGEDLSASVSKLRKRERGGGAYADGTEQHVCEHLD